MIFNQLKIGLIESTEIARVVSILYSTYKANMALGSSAADRINGFHFH